MSQKPSLPKGTRDFSPEEVAKRNYILKTIKSKFKLYGFQPIETPSFEKSSTLLGKYGDEGDRLIFRILDSGDFTKGLQKFVDELEVTSQFVETFIERVKQQIDRVADIKNFELPEKREEKSKEIFESLQLKALLESEFVRHNEQSVKRHKQDGLMQYIAAKIGGKLVETALLVAEYYEEIPKEYVKYLIKQEVANEAYNYLEERASSDLISKKALRYDLTVPFARYVVQHQNEINFPFKRYQIQPVWRADRPQKGRYREFYQCDADVIGSQSLWQEVEFIQLYDDVFSALQLKGTTIKLNNRKILSGLAEVIGESDKLIPFTVALDKLDKIGEEGVKKEMRHKGIAEEALKKVAPIFKMQGTFAEKIDQLQEILAASEIGQKGIEELQFIQAALAEMPLQTAQLDLEVTLARGLDYYTGAIIEVEAPKNIKMGSIGGGGRYDDLTGIFGLKHMSGMGISFGLDRIYLVLEELGLFPETLKTGTKIMFVNFGEKEAAYALKAVNRLRQNEICAELYPDKAKMKKQMKYANSRHIPFVILAGSKEMEAEEFTLKNMTSGTQQTLDFEQLLKVVDA